MLFMIVLFLTSVPINPGHPQLEVGRRVEGAELLDQQLVIRCPGPVWSLSQVIHQGECIVTTNPSCVYNKTFL